MTLIGILISIFPAVQPWLMLAADSLVLGAAGALNEFDPEV